ncbi:GNAT family N-acetyltransferase [Lactococcus muris]|uniref:GNAT family N-acetyltransferase n=1 Tax=Lactococcus muris TaxID=2941330 RepID=A0ABV4D861_9LACT
MNIYVRLAEHQKIESKRLWLRPFFMKDTTDMFEYSSDAANLEFIFPPHRTMEQTKFILANHFMREPLGKWAIELKDEKKMVGALQCVKLSERGEIAELAYVLNKRYWNQGLMTEALQVLTDTCLQQIGLKAIVLNCDTKNYGSIQVAKKAGYRRAGRFKGSNQYTGRISEFEKYEVKRNQAAGASHV